MDLFTLEISRDWLTPLVALLVLLSFHWFRVALRHYKGRKRYTRADADTIRTEAKRRL
jgi:hypothetical protein